MLKSFNLKKCVNLLFLKLYLCLKIKHVEYIRASLDYIGKQFNYTEEAI